MPDVLIREVDENALAAIEARARANGRTLDSELRMILERSARQQERPSARELAEAMTLRLRGRVHSDSASLLREDRAR